MKLLCIADANSIHTRRWIAPLVERGDMVHLVSYKPVHQPPPGVTVVDLTRQINWRKARFAAWGAWLWRYVRQLQPDLVHAHQVQAAGWLGVMAAYRPFVLTVWGSDLLIEPHKSTLRRALVQLTLRRCDRLTVPSVLLYRAAQELGVPEQKLSLIPWGIERDIFRPEPDDRLATRTQLGIPPDAPVILSPRGVAPLYNLDIVVEATRQAAERFSELVLVFLRYQSEAAYLAQLEAQIAAAGLAEHVRWLPPQAGPEEMARLYRLADVTVSLPSSEGYGLTVYEAMASGSPTLITDLPLFEGELRDGVHTLKVPVRDAARTAEALARLLGDVALRQQLRQAGLVAVEGQSVGERIRRSAALYQELCDNGLLHNARKRRG